MKIVGKDLCQWLGHRWIACGWKGWVQKNTIIEALPDEWECFRCREKTREL